MASCCARGKEAENFITGEESLGHLTEHVLRKKLSLLPSLKIQAGWVYQLFPSFLNPVLCYVTIQNPVQLRVLYSDTGAFILNVV